MHGVYLSSSHWAPSPVALLARPTSQTLSSISDGSMNAFHPNVKLPYQAT